MKLVIEISQIRAYVRPSVDVQVNRATHLFGERVRTRSSPRPWSNSSAGDGIATGTRRCRPSRRAPPSSCDPGTAGTAWPGRATGPGSGCTAAGRPPCTAAGSSTPRSPARPSSCECQSKQSTRARQLYLSDSGFHIETR